MAVAVVMAVVLGFVYKPAPSSPSGTVLAHSGTAYGIQASQYVALAFTASGSSTLSGAVKTTYNVSIYLMTPDQFHAYVVSTVISGSQWSSGTIASGSFSTPVPAGSWQLVFVDPSSIQATSVVLTSDVQISPS